MTLPFQVPQDNQHKRAVDYMLKELVRRGIHAEKDRSPGRYDLRIWVKDCNPFFLKVCAGDGVHFKVTRKVTEINNLLLVYIWDFEDAPACFFMTYGEALQVLGKRPLSTKSWKVAGKYSWSSATGLPRQRRQLMEARFKVRWPWLNSRLAEG